MTFALHLFCQALLSCVRSSVWQTLDVPFRRPRTSSFILLSSVKRLPDIHHIVCSVMRVQSSIKNVYKVFSLLIWSPCILLMPFLINLPYCFHLDRAYVTAIYSSTLILRASLFSSIQVSLEDFSVHPPPSHLSPPAILHLPTTLPPLSVYPPPCLRLPTTANRWPCAAGARQGCR